jgi:hypothetical protein
MEDPNPMGSKIKKEIWETWSLQIQTGRDHLSGKHLLNASVIQQLLLHLDVIMQATYDIWTTGKHREEKTGWIVLTPHRKGSAELCKNLVHSETHRKQEEQFDRKKQSESAEKETRKQGKDSAKETKEQTEVVEKETRKKTKDSAKEEKMQAVEAQKETRKKTKDSAKETKEQVETVEKETRKKDSGKEEKNQDPKETRNKRQKLAKRQMQVHAVFASEFCDIMSDCPEHVKVFLDLNLLPCPHNVHDQERLFVTCHSC